MKLYAVVMAGGVGSRFWPRSKEKTPKQLLKIFNGKTMIQNTVERLEGLIEKENIFVITNKVQKDEIVKQLKSIPEKNILIEPFDAPMVRIVQDVLKKGQEYNLYDEGLRIKSEEQARAAIQVLKWVTTYEPYREIVFKVKRGSYDVIEKARALFVVNKKDFDSCEV
ncbi:MAG: NTP transferase domain-containing protein, partial [Bacteroidetes bacterium]|nr:NTP transferase domain-containing protein [Bacteroidota bacterium]